MASLERITVYRLKVPLRAPYRLAFGPVEHYDTLVVECVGRDGGIGLGEATVLTGYTDETIEDSWRAARAIAEELAARDTADAHHRLERIVHDRPFTATAFGASRDALYAPMAGGAKKSRLRAGSRRSHAMRGGVEWS